MKLYILLKDGEPMTNDDFSTDFSESYIETGEVLMKVMAEEVCGVFQDFEMAKIYQSYIQEGVFFDNEITITEIDLNPSLNWN